MRKLLVLTIFFLVSTLMLYTILIQYVYSADSSDDVLKKSLQNLAKHEKSSSQQPIPTLSKKQLLAKPITSTAPKADFTNSNFDVLFAKPDGYTGSTVSFSGKISGFPETGALQMYIGKTNHDAIVIYNESFVFVEDECVKLTGIVGESYTGLNAFSASRTVPRISATTIDKLDCNQAIDPAIKTVKVEKTQVKAGIKVTLHKVEFSDKNTRAYLTVENLNGKTGISFYDFDSKAIEGIRQFATAYSFDVTYPAIKSDIPPRIREDGVVLFEPLNYKIPSLVKFQFHATRGDTFNSYDFIYSFAVPR